MLRNPSLLVYSFMGNPLSRSLNLLGMKSAMSSVGGQSLSLSNMGLPVESTKRSRMNWNPRQNLTKGALGIICPVRQLIKSCLMWPKSRAKASGCHNRL